VVRTGRDGSMGGQMPEMPSPLAAVTYGAVKVVGYAAFAQAR
jgi:hypothetical protein